MYVYIYELRVDPTGVSKTSLQAYLGANVASETIRVVIGVRLTCTCYSIALGEPRPYLGPILPTSKSLSCIASTLPRANLGPTSGIPCHPANPWNPLL